MNYSKNLSILTLFILTVFNSVNCQIRYKESESTKLEKPHSSQQFILDSTFKSVDHVNDYENLFSEKEEYFLDSILVEFEKKNKIQIVLVVFDTTMTSRDSLDALTLQIGNAWAIGKKLNNKGIVVGICKGYKKMRIQNSKGIEKILTDTETKNIIDEAFIPSFRDNDYYRGVLNGLTILMNTLVKNYEEKSKVTF